jgi:methyl-accepting chemotaxis protein
MSLQIKEKYNATTLEELGPIFINRIRFGLAGFYILAVIASYKATSPFQIGVYFGGIFVMIFFGFIQWHLIRKKKLKPILAKFFILVDITIAWAVTIAAFPSGAISAALQMKNAVLYVLYYYYIIYSAFLFSQGFVLVAAFYSAILVGIMNVACIMLGVQYLSGTGVLDQKGSLSPSTEILKIFFLIAAGFLVRSVIKLLIAMKDEVKTQMKNSEKEKTRVQNAKEKIQSIGELLSMSVSDLNHSINEFNTQLQSQASNVEEISASMEEFSSSLNSSSSIVNTQHKKVESISIATQKLESILGDVSGTAEFISESMFDSKEAGDQVFQSVQNLDSILKEINQSFQKVSEVNQIMSEIADRTNLLALNASIEAARAGEHGRGFAVVAQEVAKLADNSAENASTIEKIIKQAGGLIRKGSASATETNIKIIDQQKGFGELSNQINHLTQKIRDQKEINIVVIKSLSEIKDLSQEIEMNSKEQSQTSNQVSTSIGLLDGAVSELAQNSQILQETINHLENQAKSLTV